MITFTSGKLAGQWRHVRRNEGRELVIVNGGPGVEGLAAGDRFRLDNRDQLAWLYYYRHIADADEPAARELYRNGEPLYAQRSHEAMRFLDETDRQVGKISGKLITIFATEDPWAWPVLADRYHRGVRKHLGAAAEDHYRIYFVERSVHGGSRDNAGLRLISKMGLVYKAQDEMIAWVEKGEAPAPSTSYRIDSMNQLVLPGTAAERKGYQLVVRLRANGRDERIEVRVGEEIRFEAEAEDPDNGLLEAEIDFEGRRPVRPDRRSQRPDSRSTVYASIPGTRNLHLRRTSHRHDREFRRQHSEPGCNPSGCPVVFPGGRV